MTGPGPEPVLLPGGGPHLTLGQVLRRLGGFLALTAAGMAAARWTPLGQWLHLDYMAELTERLGPWGIGLILLLGLFTPLMMIPRWPLAVISGMLYGVVWGTALATVASASGAWLHFRLSRTLLAPASESLKARFGLTRLKVPKNRQFLVILLLRAFPLSSFVVTNLLAGALRIHSGRYMMATVLGMIPSSLMYASGGKLIKQPDGAFVALAAGVVALMAVGTVAAHRWLWPMLHAANGQQQEKTTS